MMRKFFTMFTAILTCLCMTACSSGGGTNTEESEQVKTVEETKEEYTINTDICHAGTDSYYREGGTGVLYGWGFLPVDADSDKKPEDGIVVVANFLNRSDSPTEFQHFFWIKAFQSGVELDDMYVYSDIEFKPLDNWTKSVMGGATIQVAKAFELNDDSPVTVRLYEQLMPDNFVEIIIDPSKKEEDSSTDKKDDKKEDGKKEEKKSKT
ncbi:MAG: DUF5067 domain-containing protein, partial [Faecalicoccus sp.]|nr:DUF5067 domain-containing protein [Faecalicoccus sp.]